MAVLELLTTTFRSDRAVITIRPVSGDAALLVECEACHLSQRVLLPINADALQMTLVGWLRDHASRCPCKPPLTTP